jgi:hypothetical protein
MGSLLIGMLESMATYGKPDADDLVVSDEMFEKGLTKVVKDNDTRFPPDWRLSKKGRAATE